MIVTAWVRAELHSKGICPHKKYFESQRAVGRRVGGAVRGLVTFLPLVEPNVGARCPRIFDEEDRGPPVSSTRNRGCVADVRAEVFRYGEVLADQRVLLGRPPSYERSRAAHAIVTEL